MVTIVTRSGKGSPLTNAEMDDNLNNLNSGKTENSAAAITGGTINGATIGATTPSTIAGTTGTFSANVGIGTSSPTEVLQIVGGNILVGTDSGDAFNGNSKIRIQGAGDEYIQIKSDGTGSVGLLFGDTTDDFTAGILSSQTAGSNLSFSAGNATRMLINSAGNVGIANTAPAQTLTVDGTIGGTIIATQAEAEAGSDNTKLMTPLRVEQALALNSLVGMNVRVFTTTGESPYIPTTGMKHCLVIATGGGGGGGGSDAADTAAAGAGSGGGAGGTTIKYYTAAQIGANAAFAIGAGGTAGGATGTDGGAGGTTTFTPSGGGAALSAAGGGLGNGSGAPAAGTNTSGGIGGTPTGGDFNITGGDGAGGVGYTTGQVAVGGLGGSSFWGGAGRSATEVSGSTAGQPGGTNTGGGGGGAATVDTTTGAVGGAGGSGVIFILEFI